MRIATWNLNSLNVRLPHLLDWLQQTQPDVVCLQETKLEDHKFPQAALQEAGYDSVYCGQKAYNGVALLTRQSSVAAVDAVQIGNPLFTDAQQRLIAATVHGKAEGGEPLRVISAYVPNGQAVDSDKYHYKLEWLRWLAVWLKAELAAHRQLVLAGDFNIAPEDQDVHDPKAWAGQILCSEAERDAYSRLLALGLRDSFRLFPQPEKTFSWWDYRMLGFPKNLGLRIDHILLSTALVERCSAAWVDRAPRKLERPSDHAPVLADL